MNKLREIIIEVSQNCNLNCIMCGFGSRYNSPSKFMNFDKFKDIFNQIKDHCESIRINGRGESTIHPNFIEIIKFIRGVNSDMSINLFSNLNYKDENINKIMIENNVILFISMDSVQKDKLEYIRKGVIHERLIKNINQLSTMQPRPFIVFTIQEENIDEIVEIGEFAFTNNCNIIYNVVRRDKGIEFFIEKVKYHKQEIIKYFDYVKLIYQGKSVKCFIPDQIAGVPIFNNINNTCGSFTICPSIDSELCILYNGDITPCNMFNPYVYGNIFNQSFENIWNGKKRLEFKKNHKDYYYCNNCACIRG